MPGRTGFEVEGLNAMVRDYQALGVELEDLKDAFADIASEGARIAAGYAPVASGALAGSLRGNRAKNKAVVTAGRARIPYAGAINYGWPARGIAAAGFMQKADEELGPKSLEMLDKNINAITRRKGMQ